MCGYSYDAPGVLCNCIYSTADGGIYVCDSFTMPACPQTLQARATGPTIVHVVRHICGPRGVRLSNVGPVRGRRESAMAVPRNRGNVRRTVAG